MLGSRDLHDIIRKSLDKLHDGLETKFDKKNADSIHAIEVVGCTRFAYYERKDPISPNNAARIAELLGNSMRHSLGNLRGEYKVEGMSLEVDADLIVANDFVFRIELVHLLPEFPHPRHLLYLNACLFAFNKDEGFLVYATADGKTVEFYVTKNNRMFEEIVRRARVLSTLLKDNKVPIVEPSELCLSCRYYERCYARKQDKEEGQGFILEQIFKKK